MLEDELMARDRWSREDLLAYQWQRVRALVLPAVTHVTSTGAVAPAVDVQVVSALQREPVGKLRLVRSA